MPIDSSQRYLEEHARKRNKSWRQADALIRRYLLPRWGKLDIGSIRRADVKAAIAAIVAPVLANQVLVAASAIFRWAVRQEIISANPCSGVEKNSITSRERVLSDAEIAAFWPHLSAPLKMILLTGQRPGEVAHLHCAHVVDGGWWVMPGAPDPKTSWPGTKNAQSHRVWLSEPVRELLSDVLAAPVRTGQMQRVMRDICAQLEISEKVTPHDLRRTFCSKVTALGFGRDAMNRVTNHKEGGIADVYDRHRYQEENKMIMETVARHIVTTGRSSSGVIGFIVDFDAAAASGQIDFDDEPVALRCATLLFWSCNCAHFSDCIDSMPHVCLFVRHDPIENRRRFDKTPACCLPYGSAIEHAPVPFCSDRASKRCIFHDILPIRGRYFVDLRQLLVAE